ncbi:hypothetical protein [Streptomyces sp. Amel2xC10]|uniref:hypothetical protein n=1 Tax=Streptomyces sp. Amel2xC10 TaxID=1305826 RepID=UPI000A0889C0|nr:hypothetical protein [Streptomyces sp. Amel2xC10]SMF80043.1 hypothetical protein SAMN02745830_06211 [Streptomyces sp. Amel2xC10]
MTLGTVLTSCDSAPSGSADHRNVTVGTALDGGMQAEAEIAFEHAQVGEEYWVSLPLTSNASAKPLTLEKAEITHVPKGLRIIGYRAVSARDTDGHAMGVAPAGTDQVHDLEHARDHADRPVRVESDSVSDVYYLARLRVTGPVRADLTGCRYRYRQGGAEYRQDLPCVTRIRLGEPLEPEA